MTFQQIINVIIGILSALIAGIALWEEILKFLGL